MALKDRVKRIESAQQFEPQISAAQWWSEVLAKPKENEDFINAALLLAMDGTIQKPPPRLWEPLDKTVSVQDWSLLSDSLHAYLSFYALDYCEDPAHKAELEESFADDDGKEWLCLIALTTWAVFKTAPLPPVPEKERWKKKTPREFYFDHLQKDYLLPLFHRIFPIDEKYGFSYDRFQSWLDLQGEVESFMESLQAHMFKGQVAP